MALARRLCSEAFAGDEDSLMGRGGGDGGAEVLSALEGAGVHTGADAEGVSTQGT